MCADSRRRRCGIRGLGEYLSREGPGENAASVFQGYDERPACFKVQEIIAARLNAAPSLCRSFIRGRGGEEEACALGLLGCATGVHTDPRSPNPPFFLLLNGRCVREGKGLWPMMSFPIKLDREAVHSAVHSDCNQS